MSDIRGQERISVGREVESEEDADHVFDDGTMVEEFDVYNHVNIKMRHYVNSVNGHETFEPEVSAGDAGFTPDYVTERIADYLYMEFHIDVEDLGIEVIDFDDEDIHIQ